jgi:hypothetical protein
MDSQRGSIVGTERKANDPVSSWPAMLPLAITLCLGIGLTGCKTYTAYLHLDPQDSARARLNETQRREADAIVAATLFELGFMRDPRQSRLQQKSRNSVQFDYSVMSSYVPKGAVSGHRLTIATVIQNSNGRFAVLIRDLSAGEPIPLVVSIQEQLTAALAERFPGFEPRLERTRFGPRGTY